MKKARAIFLASLFLLSQSGVALTTHLCGGQAVMSAFVLGDNAHLDCGMSAPDSDCESHPDSAPDPSCCDDQSLSIDTEDEYRTAQSVSLDIQFYTSFPLSFPAKEWPVDGPRPAPAQYAPPLPTPDITVLHRVFRI